MDSLPAADEDFEHTAALPKPESLGGNPLDLKQVWIGRLDQPIRSGICQGIFQRPRWRGPGPADARNANPAGPFGIGPDLYQTRPNAQHASRLDWRAIGRRASAIADFRQGRSAGHRPGS